MNPTYTSRLLLLILAIAIAFAINCEYQRNQNIIKAEAAKAPPALMPKPGTTYLYSLAFDTTAEIDPFGPPATIDTVQVIAIKKGYVKYRRYNSTFNVLTSGPIKYFKYYIKPINF